MGNVWIVSLLHTVNETLASPHVVVCAVSVTGKGCHVYFEWELYSAVSCVSFSTSQDEITL